MKRNLILSVVLMIAVISSAIAQNFRVGIAGGIDASKIALSGGSGGPLNFRTEPAGGLSFEAVISPTFSVQLEGNYSAQGTGVTDPEATTAGSYQFSYITIPLLAKLYGNKQLSFLVGPQLGILVKAKTKSSGDPDIDVKDQLETTDFYAVFGAEYRFANGVFISSRYNAGLKNIVKDESTNTEIKNRYFSFRIGYSFAIGN